MTPLSRLEERKQGAMIHRLREEAQHAAESAASAAERLASEEEAHARCRAKLTRCRRRLRGRGGRLRRVSMEEAALRGAVVQMEQA